MELRTASAAWPVGGCIGGSACAYAGVGKCGGAVKRATEGRRVRVTVATISGPVVGPALPSPVRAIFF